MHNKPNESLSTSERAFSAFWSPGVKDLVPLDPSILKALFDESHLSCQSHSYSSLYNKNPKYFFKQLKQQKITILKYSIIPKMTNFEEKQFLEHEEYVPKIKAELEKMTGGDLDKLEQCENLANAFATYDRNVFA